MLDKKYFFYLLLSDSIVPTLKPQKFWISSNKLSYNYLSINVYLYNDIAFIRFIYSIYKYIKEIFLYNIVFKNYQILVFIFNVL